MNQELIENLFEASVRAETIVHIGAMALQDGWSSSVEEAFEEDLDEVVDALSIPLTFDMEKDEIVEMLHDKGKLGWLVKFSTPIPSHFHKSGWSFSWGMYTSEWFYGDDFEELCKKAIQWKDSVIAHYRDKWEKENAA